MPIPLSSHGSVPRTLRKDEVYERILGAILDGTLEPGERIRDGELKGWLGVSRTPIRLALDRLEGMRLVESVPNRYTRVCDAAPDLVPHLVEVLCGLWSLAVQLTVERLDPAGQRECRRLLHAAVEACREHSGDDATLAVESMRGALSFFSERSGNPLLANLVVRAGAPLRFQLGSQGAALDVELLVRFFLLLDSAVADRNGRDADEAVRYLRSRANDVCRVPLAASA